MNTWLDRFLQDDLAVFSVILNVSAVGVIIASLEWISLRSRFKEDGIYSWPIRRTRIGFPLKGPARSLFEFIYKYPNVLVLPILQIIGSVIVLASWKSRVPLSIGSGIVALASIFLSLRGMMGYTGADQMLKITFTASALCLASPSRWLWQTGLIFIAAQLVVAYTTPGLLRLGRRSWLDGTALHHVLRQHTYGRESVWRLTKRFPQISRVVSLGIIVFECSLIWIVFMPLNYVLAYLVIGCIFHLANAVVMGLNTFFWAFVGGYPAIIWVSWKVSPLN